MTKRKTKVPSTETDAPALKEKGALDMVRILILQNPGITSDEVKAQLELTGKTISPSSLASVFYEVKKTMTLLTELGRLKD